MGAKPFLFGGSEEGWNLGIPKRHFEEEKQNNQEIELTKTSKNGALEAHFWVGNFTYFA